MRLPSSLLFLCCVLPEFYFCYYYYYYSLDLHFKGVQCWFGRGFFGDLGRAEVVGVLWGWRITAVPEWSLGLRVATREHAAIFFLFLETGKGKFRVTRGG